MPTKPNKAGQQQPYVPAGHGDVSGEYGEHGTGSNKHWVSPDDVKRQLGYKEEQPKKESETPKELSDKLNGNKTDTEKLKDFLSKSFLNENQSLIKGLDSVNKDNLRLVVQNIEDGRVKLDQVKGQIIAGCKINSACQFIGTVFLKKNDDIDVFFHENGHAVDEIFGQKLNSRFISNSYISEKYNTTLADMLRAEGRKIKVSELENIIKKEENDYINNELSKLGFKNNEAEEVQTMINNTITNLRKGKYKEEAELLDKEEKQLSNQYFEKQEISRDEFFKKSNEIRDKEWELSRKIIQEANEMFKPQKERIDKIQKIKNDAFWQYRKYRTKKYGDLSDIISGAKRNAYGLIGVGHPTSYWNKKVWAREAEFFAEAFSAKTSNPDSYEVIKKYYPKTVEIFEEILNKGVNNKL